MYTYEQKSGGRHACIHVGTREWGRHAHIHVGRRTQALPELLKYLGDVSVRGLPQKELMLTKYLCYLCKCLAHFPSLCSQSFPPLPQPP